MLIVHSFILKGSFRLLFSLFFSLFFSSIFFSFFFLLSLFVLAPFLGVKFHFWCIFNLHSVRNFHHFIIAQEHRSSSYKVFELVGCFVHLFIRLSLTEVSVSLLGLYVNSIFYLNNRKGNKKCTKENRQTTRRRWSKDEKYMRKTRKIKFGTLSMFIFYISVQCTTLYIGFTLYIGM